MADFVIIGAGVVGLSIALEIRRRESGVRIILLEKERRPGLHSSGRNSGVLHSGIYYPAGSLKARLCGTGAREMADYCTSRNLPLNRLGKILLPTQIADAPQLDLLTLRGVAKGIDAQRLNSAELRILEPEARSATGEALFVPSTAVVNPEAVMAQLVADALDGGIELRCGGTLDGVDVSTRTIEWAGERMSYGHAVNTAGLYSDRVAQRFGVGNRYAMLPFKGIYWRLDPRSNIHLNHLVYPVPDLRVPFLGVHSTTTVQGDTYLGPTAVPAFGRENYCGMSGVQPVEAALIAWRLTCQFAGGNDGFRRLAWQEGTRYRKARFAAAVRKLLPRVEPRHLLPCDKVGIRAQLVDHQERRLVTDFLIETGTNSTHVLNAISPAFTSAFPLARFVCDHHLEV